ncbi:MAG: dihydrofolate reductase, partial [Clostridiales bacterium]|nr:dihydrofolate reductase [Clostridiales bacterium]
HKGVIGLNNDMPWHLPEDLKYFQRTTMGKTVVMGRKTFESLKKPLKGRKNIILTRNKSFAHRSCLVLNSLEDVLAEVRGEKETFIIGGAKIYRLFLPYAKRIYMTYIDHEFEGDTFLPEISLTDWILTSETPGRKDEKNPYNYYFRVYDRASTKEKL